VLELSETGVRRSITSGSEKGRCKKGTKTSPSMRMVLGELEHWSLAFPASSPRHYPCLTLSSCPFPCPMHSPCPLPCPVHSPCPFPRPIHSPCPLPCPVHSPCPFPRPMHSPCPLPCPVHSPCPFPAMQVPPQSVPQSRPCSGCAALTACARATRGPHKLWLL